MAELERVVKFEPAFDKRDSDPNKNYGIHGVNLRMGLKGPLGAVVFTLFTNWQLPHVTAEQDSRPNLPSFITRPMPADLGYHAKKEAGVEEEYSYVTKDCEWTGGYCCYDGSSLAAEHVYQILLTKGDEGVWKFLEEYYHERLGVYVDAETVEPLMLTTGEGEREIVREEDSEAFDDPLLEGLLDD